MSSLSDIVSKAIVFYLLNLFNFTNYFPSTNDEGKGKGKGKVGQRKEGKTIYIFVSFQQSIMCKKKKKSLVLNYSTVL